MADFYERIEKIPEGGCWIWMGPLTTGGYGMFHDVNIKKRILAHRFSYQDVTGIKLPPRTSKKCLDHLCRNRCCVNPSHLELVTYSQNLCRSLETHAGINSRRTHCKRGHEFTKENTYISTSNSRICRTCKSAHNVEANKIKKLKRKLKRSAHGGQ